MKHIGVKQTVPKKRKTGSAQSADRRAKAFQLRASGATYREIAIAMRQIISPENGQPMYKKYSTATAYRDIRHVLAELHAERLEMAADYLDMQLQALDMASKAIAHRVRNGELLAIDRWLGIIDRRMRLLGLEAPVKLQIKEGLDRELDQFLDFVQTVIPQQYYRKILEAIADGRQEN